MAKSNTKRKIAIIAGSRAEYGYFRPVIREIQKRPKLDYGIIVVGMNMLDAFGSTIQEIRHDRFKIHAALHSLLDGYNTLTMAKSLSMCMMQFPELFEQMKTDLILLSGDRGEQLMAAIAGAHMNIPVAHIQSGEISGNIDGLTRHAVTKFAHIHFCANKDAEKRVIKMGEERHRVFTVGAPMLDELYDRKFITPKNQVCEKFSITRKAPIMLLVYHSVTEEVKNTRYQIMEVIRGVSRFRHQTIVILNNNDAGSSVIRNAIIKTEQPFMRVFPSVRRQDYAGLLAISDVIVGNSSSGIIEAPTFKLPAVNIGNRERGRLQGINVINVGYDAREIEEGIKKAMSPAFKKQMASCQNPYGDGKSSKRIVDIIEQIKIDSRLLIKSLTY